MHYYFMIYSLGAVFGVISQIPPPWPNVCSVPLITTMRKTESTPTPHLISIPVWYSPKPTLCKTSFAGDKSYLCVKVIEVVKRDHMVWGPSREHIAEFDTQVKTHTLRTTGKPFNCTNKQHEVNTRT
jgi:hypothetical protein